MALSMKPTGWFQVGYGADVPPGAVLGMRYFDEDLVAFRSAQKAALPDDVRIWRHQRYVEHPPFTRDEARGWRELRRWTARFYPAG